MSYLPIKIIGTVIDLDDEECPEDLVYEWESRVRAKFKENSIIESEEALDALMKWYLQTIKEEAINFEEYQILKSLTTKHLQHFKLQFIELNCCFMDNYLDNIEEILLFYVNLEIKCLPRKEKSNKREFKRTLSSVFYKIINTLNVYLMNREDRLFHVIMKVKLNLQCEEAKDLVNLIYSNLLTKEPKNKSDLAFCRWYILYQKWKLIRKPNEWERMDEVVYSLHGRTPESIKTNPVLKQILLPQSNSILDILVHVTEKHIIICEEYFKYIKSRVIQEDSLTSELGAIEAHDNCPDVADDEDQELNRELRNFHKDISCTVVECDDPPDQIENIKVESDSNSRDDFCQFVLPSLTDADIVHEIVEDMEIVYLRKKNNVTKEAEEKKCEKSFLDSINTTDYNDVAMEIVSSSTSSVEQANTKHNVVETTVESADSATSASIDEQTPTTNADATSVSQTEPILAEAVAVESIENNSDKTNDVSEEPTEVVASNSNCVSSVSNIVSIVGSPVIESTTCSKVCTDVITTCNSATISSPTESEDTNNLSSSVDVSHVDSATLEGDAVSNEELQNPSDISIENSVLVDAVGNISRDYTVEIENSNKNTDVYYDSVNSCTSDEPKLRCIYSSKCKSISPCASPDYIDINDENRFVGVTCTSPDITSTSKDVPDFVETVCNGEVDSIGNESIRNDSNNSVTETETGSNNESFHLEEYSECNRDNENVTQSNLEDNEEKLRVEAEEDSYVAPDILPNRSNINTEDLTISAIAISNSYDNLNSTEIDGRSSTIISLRNDLEITPVKTVATNKYSKSFNRNKTKVSKCYSEEEFEEEMRKITQEEMFTANNSSYNINSTSDYGVYKQNRSNVIEFPPSSNRDQIPYHPATQSASYSDFPCPVQVGKLVPKTLKSLQNTPQNSNLNNFTVTGDIHRTKTKEVKRVKIAGTMDSNNSEPNLTDVKNLRSILKKTSIPDNTVRQKRRRSKYRIPRSIMNLKSFNHYKVKPNDPCIQRVPYVEVPRVSVEMYNFSLNSETMKSFYKTDIFSIPPQELLRIDYDKHTSHISENDIVRYSSSNQVASLPDTISRWSSNSNSSINSSVEGMVTSNSVNIAKTLDPIADFSSLNIQNPKPKNYSKSTVNYPHPQYNQFYHQNSTATNKNFSSVMIDHNLHLQQNSNPCIINTGDNMNISLTPVAPKMEELRRLGEKFFAAGGPEENLYNRNINSVFSIDNIVQPVTSKAVKSRRSSVNAHEAAVPGESKKLHYTNVLTQDMSQSMLPKIEKSKRLDEETKLHRPSYNMNDPNIAQSMLPKIENSRHPNISLSFSDTSIVPKVEKSRRFTGSVPENKKLRSKPAYNITDIMPKMEASQRYTGNYLDVKVPEENKSKKPHLPPSLNPAFNISDLDIIQQSLVMAEITNLRNSKNDLHYQNIGSATVTDNMNISAQPSNVPLNYPLAYDSSKYVNVSKDYSTVGPSYLNNFPDDHLNYKSSATDTEICINTIEQHSVVPAQPVHSNNSQNYLPTAVPLNFDICMPLYMPTIETDVNLYTPENDMNNYLRSIQNDSSAVSMTDGYNSEDSSKTIDHLPLKKRKVSESHSILSLLNNNTVSYAEPGSNVNTLTDPVSLVKEKKANFKEPTNNNEHKPLTDSFRFEKKYTQRAIEDSYVSYPNIPMMSIAALTEPTSRHMIKTAAARKEMPFHPQVESNNTERNRHHNNHQPIINCHNGSAIVIVNYARTDVNVNVPSQPTSIDEYQQESCRTRDKSKMRR